MSRDNPNRNRIFVGRLNPEARVRDLENFFKDNGFSRLKDVNIKLGYAFVEFEDKRDADDAVYELDRKEFFGSRLTVEHAKHGPRADGDRRDRRGHENDRITVEHATGTARGGDTRGERDRGGYSVRERGRGRPYNTEWRLIVTNLSSRVGWMDLKDYFRSAGEVTFTKANKERVGEGVVEFRSYREMKRALKKFDGSEFFDRRIKLIDDSPGPPRDYSGSRSRSRSRHRSRSKSKSSRSRSPKKRSVTPKLSRSRSRSRTRSRSRKIRSRSRDHSLRATRSKSSDKALNGDD